MTLVQKRLLVIAVVLVAAVVAIMWFGFFLVLAACATSGWIGWTWGQRRTEQAWSRTVASAWERANEWKRKAKELEVGLQAARDENTALTVARLHQRMDRGRAW